LKYCSKCGGLLTKTIPSGDDRLRLTCTSCSAVFYDSWQVLVQAVVFSQDKILLMKRATEPFKGCWTFPGGFVESHENLKVAASRELFEETGISVTQNDFSLLCVMSVQHMNQIQILFRARIEETTPKPNEEAERVEWFLKENVPEKDLRKPEGYSEILHLLESNQSGDFNMYLTTATEDSFSWESYPLKQLNHSDSMDTGAAE
jgi:ADP-ribose pyrophosphatase YjhB (NUDIX family)